MEFEDLNDYSSTIATSVGEVPCKLTVDKSNIYYDKISGFRHVTLFISFPDNIKSKIAHCKPDELRNIITDYIENSANINVCDDLSELLKQLIADKNRVIAFSDSYTNKKDAVYQHTLTSRIVCYLVIATKISGYETPFEVLWRMHYAEYGVLLADLHRVITYKKVINSSETFTGEIIGMGLTTTSTYLIKPYVLVQDKSGYKLYCPINDFNNDPRVISIN